MVIVAGEQWVVTLPYTLHSLKRQLYPLEKIEVIIVTADEFQTAIIQVCERYPELTTRIVLDEVSGVHDPSYRKRLGWQVAQGEIFIGLDADIILPAYAISYVTAILQYYVGFAVYSQKRKDITVANLEIDLNKTFSAFDLDESLVAGYAGRMILNGVYPKHPWSCPSFFFAVERSLLRAEDFVTEYGGMWGVEDNDLTASLYKRGVHPISHPHLFVLHWDHVKQSDELYEAQLKTALKRHTESYIINRDLVMMQAHKRVSSWKAPKSFIPAYTLHIEPQGDYHVNSSSVVLASLFIALRTQARFDNRLLPTLGSLHRIKHFLPHDRLLDREDYCETPHNDTSFQVRVWGLLYDKFQPLPARGAYNIGYLALEGEVIDTNYLSYLQLFDALWVPSQRNADSLRAYGWLKPLAVISHGIFSEYFFPRRFRPQRDAQFQFLTIGEGGSKQTYDIIDRFATEFTPHEKVGLTIGDSSQSENIKVYIQHYWPRWQGLIQDGGHEQNFFALSQHFLTSDAFVMASRGEAWQLPVLEAMACGMPVIVPRDNGIPYVNDTNAIQFDSKPHLDALMQTMRALVTNPQAYQQRAQQLVETVHSQYSWFAAARTAWQWLDENIPHA